LRNELGGDENSSGNDKEREALIQEFRSRVVQWDWRTRWEKDGSLKNLPLTEKWLKRVGQMK